MKRNSRQGWLIWLATITAGIVFLVAVLVLKHRRRTALKEIAGDAGLTFIPPGLQGLTSQEVESRMQEGLSNAIDTRPDRTTHEIIRYNTFSIFNLSLIGIGFIQLMLGRPLDALLSLGVILLNISLNTIQELLAKRRLQAIQAASQDKATVLRESLVAAIEPDHIVIGDLLIVGPGDRLFVDGIVIEANQFSLDESIITGTGGTSIKEVGDPLYAGSYCISGNCVYEAAATGPDRKITEVLLTQSTQSEQLTPIEHIINRILRIMLVVVSVFSLILLSRYYRIDLGIDTDLIIDAANVIFSLAPAGLFFMILLTYTGGTADLVKSGALVQRARSVELMAQVNVICFAEAGVITGSRVDLQTIDQGEGAEGLSETRIRQILGDFSRSLSYSNLPLDKIRESFEGNTRSLPEQAPFMSVYGWSGAVFSDPDLRGTYILGDERRIQGALVNTAAQEGDTSDQNEQESTLRKLIGRIGGRRTPGKDESPSAVMTDAQKSLEQTASDSIVVDPENQAPRQNPLKRVWGRLKNLVPGRNKNQETQEPGVPPAEQFSLLFAYSPKTQPLHDPDGRQVLPTGLIPLGTIHFSTQVRQETIDVLHQFEANGVQAKVFSARPAEEIAGMLLAAGWQTSQDDPPHLVNASDLLGIEGSDYEQAITRSHVIGELTPRLTSQIVQDLRKQGLFVSVLGDGINDIPALRQADLAIALKSSNQVVRSTAGILLLEDSPSILFRVLSKGQKIVNGLMSILKLYLTQILYLTLLILAIRLFSFGFPYRSAQGGLISFLTLTIPSLGFSFWAAAGITASSRLTRNLRRFVIPAGITLAIMGTFVYTYFLNRYLSISYAQLALTYALVIAGLLLALLLQPPFKVTRTGLWINPDQRFTLLIVIGLLIFGLLVTIPLSQQLFRVERLQQSEDLITITVAVFAWLAGVLIINQFIKLIPSRTGQVNT